MRRIAALAAAVLVLTACQGVRSDALRETGYPWHTDIVATTFWVGEIFDAEADDGSQMISTYDANWYGSYGGCDGILVVEEGAEVCTTEQRTAENDFFPTSMTPLENPFYLDLPFDDLNDETGFALRAEVIPWADDPAYASIVDDPTQSLMKNRWVVLHRDGRYCYGQIQDAGPALYADADYVFGEHDERPANTRFDGAGLDVSPALNGCLSFTLLDGSVDTVDWSFIEAEDVPEGPWTRLVTTSPARG